MAFKDKRLFTAVGIWKGASDLIFIAYGQNKKLGEYLYERIIERKINSRSTQNIDIVKLICDYSFIVMAVSKNKKQLFQILSIYNKK